MCESLPCKVRLLRPLRRPGVSGADGTQIGRPQLRSHCKWQRPRRRLPRRPVRSVRPRRRRQPRRPAARHPAGRPRPPRRRRPQPGRRKPRKRRLPSALRRSSRQPTHALAHPADGERRLTTTRKAGHIRDAARWVRPKLCADRACEPARAPAWVRRPQTAPLRVRAQLAARRGGWGVRGGGVDRRPNCC